MNGISSAILCFSPFVLSLVEGLRVRVFEQTAAQNLTSDDLSSGNAK
jgi:hypothetical protein